MSPRLAEVMPAPEPRDTVAPPPAPKPPRGRRLALRVRRTVVTLAHGAKQGRDAIRSGVLQFSGLGAFAAAGFTVNVTTGLVLTGAGLFFAEWLTSDDEQPGVPRAVGR